MNKVEFENKDNEIARLWEHKKVDTQTIQEQSDLIEELKYELAVFKKAYEMVCEYECSIKAYDYYIQQAKEMMKSE